MYGWIQAIAIYEFIENHFGNSKVSETTGIGDLSWKVWEALNL